MSVRKDIREQLPEEAVVFNDFAYDNSIIGTTTDGRVVYSYEMMVQELVLEENVTDEQARAWIDYNTIRSLPYIPEAVRPVVMEAPTWE